MKRTTVEWLVDGLRQRGVEWISALCGHGLDPLFDACQRGGIRIVDVRNEQTAGYIADYAGRLTRRPGVCASSSGVAVANLLTGAMNAWFDGAPMLAISGSADLTTLGSASFQDSPHVELAAPITNVSRRLDDPTRVLELLVQAWPTRGPAHIMLPMDVQRAQVDEADLVAPTEPPASNASESLDLTGIERPLIIAGSGVFYAGAGAALIDCAERLRIPVQTPIWDRGVFDRESDVFCGVVGAATGGPDLIDRSDLLILAGVETDYRIGYLKQGKRHARMLRGWESLKGGPWNDWCAEARASRDAYTAKIDATGRGHNGTHAVDVVDAIRQALPDDGVLVIDGGSIGQWAHQLLCGRRYPSHWLTCGRSGVVGYGLAGAIAARLAHPDRAVVLLSGDGAFTFTVAEIECAVRQRLPFVAIVADDRCWGITHSGHLKQFGHGIGTELGEIRFDDLAKSMGARGERIDSAVRIGPAIREGIHSAQVTVLHVPIVGGNPV